jgi:aryl-alcohol dehydrogenase-like predicted oxidoreductase
LHSVCFGTMRLTAPGIWGPPSDRREALAWLLKRSPVLLPIPGTSKASHLEENMQAALVSLTDEEFAELGR